MRVLRVALSVGDRLGRSPPPPFIDTRRGGVHVREGEEIIVFSLNRGRTVDSYCRKYTLGYWRLRRRACGRPGRRPWPCGDCAGVIAAPTGGHGGAVESTVLQA